MPPKPRAVGITDVARLAGVSTATVSRTLMTPSRVKPATRDAVMAAVAAIGYTPNQAARSLRARKSMMAMVIVPTLANLFFSEVIRGIDAALSRAGYGLIIGNLDNQRARERHFVDLAFAGQVDGVLLMNGWMLTKDDRSLRDSGLPIVALSSSVEGADIPKVVVQDREAAAAAAAHLIALGHRRLGYVSGPADNWVADERWRGFREGVAAAGLDPSSVVYWQGSFHFPTGTTAAEAFLRLSEPPTGIFACSDEMAIAFIKRIRQAGHAVPEAVSVVGFDGIEFSLYSEPTLTTIHQPRHEMGRIGASVLLSMINEPGIPQPEWTRMPVPLVPRDSTGPAPTHGRVRKPATVVG
ncbi:MAG: LacI family DNA-binding transcriptional regulator [Alphaproteobacteria bacterium]